MDVLSLRLLVICTYIYSSDALFTCGSFPHQYYSNTPCTYSPQISQFSLNTCQNGGKYLNSYCSNALECWSIDPFADCIGGKCCEVPAWNDALRNNHKSIGKVFGQNGGQIGNIMSKIFPFVRFNRHSNANSPSGDALLENACFGEPSIAVCLGGLCPVGYHCTKEGYCCSCLRGKSVSSCSISINTIDNCPNDYTCDMTSLSCCPKDNRLAVQLCVDHKCPRGSRCDRREGICYKY